MQCILLLAAVFVWTFSIGLNVFTFRVYVYEIKWDIIQLGVGSIHTVWMLSTYMFDKGVATQRIWCERALSLENNEKAAEVFSKLKMSKWVF